MQHVYQSISGYNLIIEASTVDWKKKVTDFVLVGQNVKDGRCIVRTLATTQGVRRRTTLEVENPTIYKDYFLCGWLQAENFGSYGGVTRIGSHVIDMVIEEATSWRCENTLFLNKYTAKTPSNYYGGAIFTDVEVQKFDPTQDPYSIKDNSVQFDMESHHRTLIQNYDWNSDYVGFSTGSGPTMFRPSSSLVIVVNAETGKVVYSSEGTIRVGHREVQLFDNYLALSKTPNWLDIVDVRTRECVNKRLIQEKFDLGFMTNNTIIIRTEQIIIEWNFIDNTDVIYPAGHMPMSNIEMIYHDMWVVYNEGKMSFYNLVDGSKINTLTLRKGSKYDQVSLLSDGRICVASRSGCRVISFVSSEVNRQIRVDLMDVNGSVTSHEISAYELSDFFKLKVGKPYEMMISRVIDYPQKSTRDTNERFVLICTQDEKSKTLPENVTATKLLKTEVKPTCVNTPYQAWTFDDQSIVMRDFILDRVCGNAIIVRETKVNGRWQLASMKEPRRHIHIDSSM